MWITFLKKCLISKKIVDKNTKNSLILAFFSSFSTNQRVDKKVDKLSTFSKKFLTILSKKM